MRGVSGHVSSCISRHIAHRVAERISSRVSGRIAIFVARAIAQVIPGVVARRVVYRRLPVRISKILVGLVRRCLAPRTASALHLGSCQWLDAVLYDLPKLTADSNGNASSSITINHAQPVSASNNWYIAIDYSSTLNRSYFMPIICGTVVGVSPS